MVQQRLLGTALVFSLFLPISSGPSRISPTPNSHREILDAIRLVESGGREKCPDGDGGQSIGPYQIWRSYWLDAVKFDPSIGGTYQDCCKRVYAEKVVRAYMNRYVPEAWKSLNAEVIARTHHGGPRGARKASTLNYWKKVKKTLASQLQTRS